MAEQLDTTAFEKQLRALIESGSIESAELLIREAAKDIGEFGLIAALDRPLSSFAIEGWTSIGADMVDAKRRVPPSERSQEFQAVFVGLVNHTGEDELLAQVRFGFDPKPSKPAAMDKPQFMTEAEFEGHKRDLERRVFLPRGHDYGAGSRSPGLKLAGFEGLLAIERMPASDEETQVEQGLRWRRQALSAAAILLRFHQLVELYAADPGLPRSMALFAHVASVSWPMEQGIYEFGTQATRLLPAAGDRFDQSATEKIIQDRASERAQSYIIDTRQIICELREKQEALDLWPRWFRPVRRNLFAGFVRANQGTVRRAMADMHGVDASTASGEALYEIVAAARHPEKPKIGLEPLGPENRTDLHRLAIAFAKRFGGQKISERFVDHPNPPSDLFEALARK